MRILITGGAGFIGSHLADRLVADGHQITILDNLATGRKENFSAHLGGNSVSFIEGSILDLPLLDGLIKETEYVIFFTTMKQISSTGGSRKITKNYND